MAIFKIQHRSSYVQIPNATLRDKQLSLEARGCLAYLLTHTDEFELSSSFLMREFRIGKDKLQRILSELKDQGYLQLFAVQSLDGRFIGKRWDVYPDRSQNINHITSASSDDGEPEKPGDGKPTCRENQLPENNALFLEDQLRENISKERTSEENVCQNPNPVSQVFEYWRTVLNHPTARLTDERKRLVKLRLKNGYDIDQIKLAIDGCKNSPYHMGQNDTGTVYDDLTLICRSGSKLEQFISYNNRKEPVNNGTTSKPISEREKSAQRGHNSRLELDRLEREALARRRQANLLLATGQDDSQDRQLGQYAGTH